MTIDGTALRKARQAAERLRKTEQDMERARTDYHRAIRQLHLTGATLREIAAALNLSFQRVHQIIDKSGAGWSRWWRRGEAQRDVTCSFCGVSGSKGAALVHGPDVAICGRCVALADDSQKRNAPTGGKRAGFRPIPTDSPLRCSFCGRAGGAERHLVTCASGSAQVCDGCLALSRKILKSQGG